MRARLLVLIAGLALAMGLAASASAAPITTLFNTGVNSAGVVLADGTIGDPHYSLVSVPGGTTSIRIRTSAGGYPIPPYFGDNLVSRWIGPNNSPALDGPTGTYQYRTTFDLTGFDPATAFISGGWSTDNNGVNILINGIGLGFTTSFTQFSAGFAPFVVPGGFLPGINTLDFLLVNGGGPTALRVEMTGRADPLAIPEPATILLLGLGVGAVGLARRENR